MYIKLNNWPKGHNGEDEMTTATANHIDTIFTHELGFRNGNKRLWLNNELVKRAGLAAGTPFVILYEKARAVIKAVEEAKRHVAKGTIIDIENRDFTKTFKDFSKVNVTYLDGEIVVEGHHAESKILEREESLLSRLKKGEPLRMGGLYVGTGLLCRSIHRGLNRAGVKTQMRFANEFAPLPADVNVNNNEIWEDAAPDALFYQDDIFHLNLRKVPTLDMLVMGSPCTPFSQLNTQKGADEKDIFHAVAGTTFQPNLNVIGWTNPAIVALENSPNFTGSTYDYIMSEVMERFGYKKSEVVIKGSDFGGFEARARLFRIWYSKNLGELDMAQLMGDKVNQRTVADIIEPMDLEDKRYARRAYLEKKQAEEHNGHGYCIVNMDDTRLATMGANYHKVQPDSPMVPHPTKPFFTRIFTPSEHCNVRSIEGNLKKAIVAVAEGTHHLTKRTNASAAHKMLGNSCSPEAFEAGGEFVGNWMMGLIGGAAKKVAEVAKKVVEVVEIAAPKQAANVEHKEEQLMLF